MMFFSRVIGPKCLLTCFMEQVPIPFTKYPIYNMVMRGLMITTSNMSAESKVTVDHTVCYFPYIVKKLPCTHF